MSSRFINGAKYAFSTTVAAPVAFSAVSNAAPPVLLASVTPNDGSIVIVNSGWTELNETVSRTSGEVDSVSFRLESADATDTVRYPPGEGTGTYAIASAFVAISQVRDVQTQGGEQQFFTYQHVEDQNGVQRRVPTFKNAMGMDITMDFDSSLGWYASLIELDRLRKPVVMRETLPNGDLIYYYGYLSFNKVPSHQLNENMTVKATFSLLCDPVRYDA